MEELPYIVAVAIIVVFLMIPNYFRIRRKDRKAGELLSEAIAAGRHEPPSIRPYVNPSKCMGSGLCEAACPEQNVIKVIDGTAQIVAGSNCIGHGACERACPVGAIELVFGSDKRGVELPQVHPDFQTNVPGLFVAGELGGMGLIANAVEQGTQAMDTVISAIKGRTGDFDVVIVGAGPAGIGAGLKARMKGLKYALLEQEDFGGAVRHYPRQKLVMTRPIDFPMYGKVKLDTLRKEALVELLSEVVEKTGLEVTTRECVAKVTEGEGCFTVESNKRTLETKAVVLALGRRGTPRKLGCQGEDTEKVAYRLIDPELYKHQHLLVVGGGDSAVEAAVALSEQPGNRVTLSYRRAEINRPKADNLERLRKAEQAGTIETVLESEVERIDLDRVTLTQRGQEIVLPNDFVFVFAGGVLPTKLLEGAGIRIETHYGKRVVSKAPAPSA